MFDVNNTGAVSIRCGAILRMSESTLASISCGSPPVAKRNCFSLIKASL